MTIGRVKVEFAKIFPAEKVRRKDLIFSLFIDLLFKERGKKALRNIFWILILKNP